MSKKKVTDKNMPVTSDSKFECGLFRAAIKAGYFIPANEEEVKIMEEILSQRKDNYIIDIPSVDDVLSRKNKISDNEIGALYGGAYAIAARKGGDVSCESRRKMAALRKERKNSK